MQKNPYLQLAILTKDHDTNSEYILQYLLPKSKVFCPNKIQMEEKWQLLYEMGLKDADKLVRINCKYIIYKEYTWQFFGLFIFRKMEKNMEFF